MNQRSKSDNDMMRLNIQITRKEYPELFDELMKFGKGIKRIQRLKTLASERLVIAGRMMVWQEMPRHSHATYESKSESEIDDMAAAAREIFGPPIK